MYLAFADATLLYCVTLQARLDWTHSWKWRDSERVTIVSSGGDIEQILWSSEAMRTYNLE